MHGKKDYDTALSRANSLLEKVGIRELSDCMPSELSGGEIRRTAIARALIHEPKFLFADEPTGDLDSQNTKIVLSLFRRLADDGMSIFLVSHDADAFPYADIVYKIILGVKNHLNTCTIPITISLI